MEVKLREAEWKAEDQRTRLENEKDKVTLKAEARKQLTAGNANRRCSRKEAHRVAGGVRGQVHAADAVSA